MSQSTNVCKDPCADEKCNGASVGYDESKAKYPDYIHVSHVMIYASTDTLLFSQHKTRAAILMQMRFDGALGFPGGLADDPREDPVAALNRELTEEVGIDVNRKLVSRGDHLTTSVDSRSHFIMHFFVVNVSLEEFCEMERRMLSSKDYGEEVMGVIRPPLYTYDRKKGFPVFLANKFAGKAREQLLSGLVHCGILTQSEVDLAKNTSDEIIQENRNI